MSALRIKLWTLYYDSPVERNCADTFSSPDEAANKVLEITEMWNQHLRPGKKPWGVMDFEDKFFIMSPHGRVLLEDLPSYCSEEWLLKNSEPVVKEASANEG